MGDSDKRAYFEELAESWDTLPGPPDKSLRVARFCQAACPDPCGRILDAGAGTGLLAPHLLGRGNGRVQLIELDFAVSMLRQSRRKHGEAGIARVCADALRLPFAALTFDAVLCFGILPHLGETTPAVAELWRVVRPGGILAVGHTMGSAELNALHQGLGGPVGNDRLPPGAELAAIFRGLGADSIEAVDEAERYFVRARRRP